MKSIAEEMNKKYMKETAYRIGRASATIEYLIKELQEGFPTVEGNKKEFTEKELYRILNILKNK